MGGARLLLDGGGTTTRVALRCADGTLAGQTEGPTCNPRSVGWTRAMHNLADVVAASWQARPAGVDSLESAWLCLSAASTPRALRQFADHLAELPSADLTLARDLWIMNDVAPLLVYDGRVADRVVAVCGTGTGFCSISTTGSTARASGAEYLLADEGGGFDLGLSGLRAVVRHLDGRGPSTGLTDALTTWAGIGADELFDLVYDSAEPKILISSFAPFVLVAARDGDSCARAIVARAADELLTGIRAVARGAGLSARFEVLLAGSNLVADHGILREHLIAALNAAMPDVLVREFEGSTLVAIAKMTQLIDEKPHVVAMLDSCLPVLNFRSSSETLG